MKTETNNREAQKEAEILTKNSYHNTNNEKGETLKKSVKKAQCQELIILDFLTQNPDFCWSCEQIQKYCNLNNVPLTSVRRAVSNLTRDGFLIKTDKMIMGQYGKMIHTWKLNL